MSEKQDDNRRRFLKSAALAGSASLASSATPAQPQPPQHPGVPAASASPAKIANVPSSYPPSYTGRALTMISYPLGGVGAGSIGLGGRGQLRDWEIVNRADKGNSPPYAFPSIWVQTEGSEAVAHVLEARIEPPYEGQTGLGSRNAPGLSRLQGATFTGEFPCRVSSSTMRGFQFT